jgi:hypothetical protein
MRSRHSRASEPAVDGLDPEQELIAISHVLEVGVTPESRTGWLWDHATAVASKSIGLRWPRVE